MVYLCHCLVTTRASTEHYIPDKYMLRHATYVCTVRNYYNPLWNVIERNNLALQVFFEATKVPPKIKT